MKNELTDIIRTDNDAETYLQRMIKESDYANEKDVIKSFLLGLINDFTEQRFGFFKKTKKLAKDVNYRVDNEDLDLVLVGNKLSKASMNLYLKSMTDDKEFKVYLNDIFDSDYNNKSLKPRKLRKGK